MCTKEMCPCPPIDLNKWGPFEQAMMLGTEPDSRVSPKAYFVSRENRRYFSFKEDGFIDTFGQCYEIFSKRDPYIQMD